MNSVEIQTEKLQVEIFVPLSTCACVYEQYLNRIFEAILPYKQFISFQVKNTSSSDAEKYEIFQNTVVVGGGTKFTRAMDLEDYLAKRFVSRH